MITNIEEQKIDEKRELSGEGSFDEKLSLDLNDGDEALRLIGTERTTQFSEEYNAKLRRKLVLLSPIWWIFELIANFIAIGLAGPSSLRRRLLHSVLVRCLIILVTYASAIDAYLSEIRPLSIMPGRAPNWNDFLSAWY